MLFKQAKYKGGKIVAPIRTAAGARSKQSYMRNGAHPNHIGKAIGETYAQGCDYEDFARLAAERFGLYKEGAIGRRGRPSQDIAEEIIVSTMEGESLTGVERALVFDLSARCLGEDCIVVGTWHINSGAKHREDLHLLFSSVLSEGDPILRKSWLTAGGATNYRALVKSLEDIVVNEINLIRSAAGRKLYPTKSELWLLRAAKKDNYSLPSQIAEWLGNKACNVKKEDVLHQLHQREWTVDASSDGQVLLLPPSGCWGKTEPSKDVKPIKAKWDARAPRRYDWWWLLTWARNAADAFERKFEEEKLAKDREDREKALKNRFESIGPARSWTTSSESYRPEPVESPKSRGKDRDQGM